MKTKVLFKLEENEAIVGKRLDVVAVFPESSKSASPGCVMTYNHYGQHSEATIPYVTSLKNATSKQYEALKRELENVIGYDLEVIDETQS